MVSATEKSGIQVDWLDRVIDENCSRRDYTVLAQQLSKRVTELREERGRGEQGLGEVRAEMALRNFAQCQCRMTKYVS